MRALLQFFPRRAIARMHFAGASCGSLIAAALASSVALDEMSELAYTLAQFATTRHWGPVGAMSHVVATGLRRLLPDDAHITCSGRLHVSLSTATLPPRNVTVSSFASKDDMIRVLLASCYIPLYYEKVSAVLPISHLFVAPDDPDHASRAARAVGGSAVAGRRLDVQRAASAWPHNMGGVSQGNGSRHTPWQNYSAGRWGRSYSAGRWGRSASGWQGLRPLLAAAFLLGGLRGRAAGAVPERALHSRPLPL